MREIKCAAGKQYRKSLPQRLEQESQTLAKLTGWNIQDIRQKANIPVSQPTPWWRSLWSW